MGCIPDKKVVKSDVFVGKASLNKHNFAADLKPLTHLTLHIMKKETLLTLAFAAMAATAATAAGNDWGRLVEGGRFMDRIMPMQGKVLTSDCWGAPGTRPRLTDNGIESPDTSYWGGNILKGADGLYHINVAGWLESSPRGHNTWSQSDTYHAVSENPWGPFRVTATLGKGHNPETHQRGHRRPVGEGHL